MLFWTIPKWKSDHDNTVFGFINNSHSKGERSSLLVCHGASCFKIPNNYLFPNITFFLISSIYDIDC